MENLDPPPGNFPYSTGIHPEMYTTSPWKIRQYAGFGTPSEANKKFKEIISQGGNGISIAFDLPTQMGLDPSSDLALFEVGKIGVSVNSLFDMRCLFEDIDISKISVSMTINATAAIHILMYQIIAEERNLDSKSLRGTIQNDILKEFICRSTYIFPIKESIRLTTDIFEYCSRELPDWNPISVSGYHFAESGATSAQEIAFAISNGLEYIESARLKGLDIEELAKKFTFFFAAKINFIQEIAKFRVARKLWAEYLKTKYGFNNEKALKMRIHAQTAGSQLTPFYIENNIVRVTIQSLAAVLGGVQSLHTNGFDEAKSIPSPESTQIAIDTQKILMQETDLLEYIDPIGGSKEINDVMITLENEVKNIIEELNSIGGVSKSVELGYQKSQIEESSLKNFVEIETDKVHIVGSENPLIESNALNLDRIQNRSQEIFNESKETIKFPDLSDCLSDLKLKANSDENLLYQIKKCLLLGATVSDICNSLREVWGQFKPIY
jgi:methylmalonyl-CoA mutase N-terminal domain/subunit